MSTQLTPTKISSPALRIGATTAATLTIWPFQYLVAVPAVWIWDATRWLLRAALHLGLWGVVALFMPVIGWAILAAYLLLRAPRPATARPPYRPGLLRPWALRTIRGL